MPRRFNRFYSKGINMVSEVPGQGLRRTKIARQLIGEPITIDGRTVQPVARVTGWYVGSGNGMRNGGGGWLRVTPVEVIVAEGEAQTYHLPLKDGTRAALRGIFFAAFLVAAGCWFLIRLLRK